MHEFRPELSETITEGVPAGCGGQPVPPCITGPLSLVNALSLDSGHLWIAEHLEGDGSRVDSFDAASGKFLPPQLDEEGGVAFLETGVAVGHAGGEERVYVGAGQEGKGVVAVFDPASGKLTHVWDGASTLNKSFSVGEKGEQAGALTGVTVDNSANPETAGDVYVSTFGFEAFPSFNVVDVLKPGAGGAEESVTQLVGTCATNQTSCPEGESFKGPSGVAVSGTSGEVLVTDREQVVDRFEPTLLGEYKFLGTLTGTPTGPGKSEVPFGRIVSVAVDGAGDIYVADQQLHVVDQFDAEGNFRGQLRGTPEGAFKSLQSVAAGPSGEVFVGDFDSAQHTGKVDAFGPTLVVPDVTTGPASGVEVAEVVEGEGRIQATLNGTVNPLGQGEAKCHFAWGTSAALGQSIACEPQGINGSTPVAVKATLEGLAPDTTYLYRTQASNANGENPGEASENVSFHTPGPGIHSQSVADVADTSATLEATIDPNGAATSYYFQYGKSTAYEFAVPTPPGEALGSGSGDVVISPRHIQGLEASTVYHYRVVAVSTLSVKGTPTAIEFPGVDQTFTTETLGATAHGAPLPDGRHWELVSPADKHGALLQPNEEVSQAESAGAAVTYQANLPTQEQVKGYIFGIVQVISERSAGGWSSQAISLPHVAPSGLPPGSEYRFFSDDLSQALVEPQDLFTSLAPEAFPPDTETTPYRRHDATCTATPSTCFEPLVTGAPGFADVPEGTKFGEHFHSLANFIGASSDLAHAVLSSTVQLTPAPTEGPQLYEWSAQKAPTERLQLLSIEPGGEPVGAKAEPQLGSIRMVRDAVSNDGSRVVWSEGGGEHHLFLRDTAKGETVQLDVPESECAAKEQCGEGQADPRYQLAASGDSRILFTDTQRLSADAGKSAGKSDLYECKVVEEAGALGCQLSDLTPMGSSGEAADVQASTNGGSLIGASEDASWVYFVANGVLGDGAEHGASPGDCKVNSGPVGEGSCSLYVEHEGDVRWIATLAGKDYPDWGGTGVNLAKQTARVSPDGQYLAFMSERPLTGYDNHDAISGVADEEVFIYHAEAGGAGSLACASCNPSGARPVGVEYAKVDSQLVGGFQVWENDAGLAANVPGWTSYGSGDGHALYQPRYLSNSGRLFFNANDALVPQDINNNQDVYEFEPAGVGDCSSTSEGFHAASGGCTALISSGRAAGESAFLDASQSGDDVFFLTGERLVSKDVDTALDLYDAHVCSSAEPCFSETASPPACITAEACRSAPTPQPDIFGSPASATFSGEGNLAAAPSPKPKKLTRAQQLAKALSLCRHRYKSQKHRRVRCEAQARKRYGPKHAKNKHAKAKARAKRK